MAYTHTQYGVWMDAQAASTATGLTLPTVGVRANISSGRWAGLSVTYGVAGFGCHQWTPACMPHRIVRVGIMTDANLANPQNLHFTVSPEAASATGVAFSVMLPTTTATGKQTVKTVTSYVVVNPGEYLRTAPSTAISSVNAAVGLWVEPVWEEVANVTSAQSPTA